MSPHVPIFILAITFLFLNYFSNGFLLNVYLRESFRMVYNMNRFPENFRFRPAPIRPYQVKYPKIFQIDHRRILECSTRPKLHFNIKFDPTYFRSFLYKNSRIYGTIFSFSGITFSEVKISPRCLGNSCLAQRALSKGI